MNTRNLLLTLLLTPILCGAKDFTIESTRSFDEEVMKQYHCAIMSSESDTER